MHSWNFFLTFCELNRLENWEIHCRRVKETQISKSTNQSDSFTSQSVFCNNGWLSARLGTVSDFEHFVACVPSPVSGREHIRREILSQPAEGLGGGRVVQGSTACLVRLVDLSASAHQGHSALVPPISSRIVQRSPKARWERIQLTFNSAAQTCCYSISTKQNKKVTLTFPLCPSYSSRYRYLRASSDIQHFCEKKKKKTRERKLSWSNRCHVTEEYFKQMQSRFCILPSRGSSV